MSTDYLKHLTQRGCDFLQTKTPILGGAMTWVSERHLVSSISNAGGFGVLASGSMSPDRLAQEIEATLALTQNPVGVNLITLHPQLMDLIGVAKRFNIGWVVLAGGIPPREALAEIKTFAKVIAFTPTLALGKRLIRQGVDALIIEGNEAGGHVGPVTTSVLCQEILPHIHEVPVFVAGGIGCGKTLLSYLEMGAAGCQLGTRFVCSHESQAHPKFKNMFLTSHARDAVVSVQLDPRLPVIPVRSIANKGLEAFYDLQREVIEKLDKGLILLKDAQLTVEHFWAGALRRAVIEGDVIHGSVMAGQCVGLVTAEESVQDIINSFMNEALDIIKKRHAALGT